MTQQDYLYPKVPVRNSDGAIDSVEQEKFNRNMIDLFRSKVSKDNQSTGVTPEDYIKQIVQNHVIDAYTYTGGGTRASMRELTCLNTTITTAKVDSKIAIDIDASIETITNSVYCLFRVIDEVETEIGSPAPAGNRYYGIKQMPYDTNDIGTMANVIIQYVDEPGVPAETEITYKLKCYGESGYSYNINRTLTDTDSGVYERVTSNVRLTEFGGTPVVSTDITAIATSAEAIAGTNDTKIITPLKLRQGLNAEGPAPVFACRAWVNFNGTGTVAIRASGNVSSITDNGVGHYLVNFTEAFEDINYVVVASAANSSTNFPYCGTYAVSVTQASVNTYVGGFQDYTYIHVAVFK